MKTFLASSRFYLFAFAALFLAACAQSPAPLSSQSNPVANQAALAPAHLFATPDDAVQALLAATKAKDEAAVHEIFGPQVDAVLSGDATQDAVEFDNFSKSLALLCKPVSLTDDKVVLYIGAKNWPFPIPLVKQNGKWFFDTAAGKEEVLNRRIGEDEITAIGVCRAYVTAQHEYASVDRDNDGVLNYAQRLNSTPGHKDGLYWDSVAGEDQSPFGPLVAAARDEGYAPTDTVSRNEPFHGYLFKILKEQGPDAPGGKYNYIINGNMIAGFALAAYPAHWGESGIMTFIVNQQGKVYQANLGEKSLDLAQAMTVFNPDKQWTVVPEEAAPGN